MSAVFEEVTSRLRGGWYWTTMGEIAEVVGGGTPRTTDPTNFHGGDVPWITPADLSGYAEKYISHGARFITRKGLESSSARLLPAGTVLFTSRAPIGYVAIARNPVATNQGFKSFVLKDGVLPEYVYWWLKSSKQRAEGLASGTTFLELSGANAKKLPIPIAPIEEQRRIVAEIEKQLSRLDEAVASLKRVKAAISRYRASTLADAAAPADGAWPSCAIGALLREPIVNGLSVKESQTPTEVRALRLSAMSEQGLNFEDHRFLPLQPPAVEDILVFEGDFFVSRGNGSLALVGRGTTAQAPPFPVIFPDTMMRLRFADPEVRRWVAMLWPIRLVRRQVEQRVKTTAGIYKIAQPQVASICVPLPSSSARQSIMTEVDRRLSIVREVEAEVDANLKRAAALRQAVLTHGFG